MSPSRTPGPPSTAYPFKITQVLPEDVKAEQALSDAFFEAGEIKKKVDVTTITDNLLPDGFDSSKRPDRSRSKNGATDERASVNCTSTPS